MQDYFGDFGEFSDPANHRGEMRCDCDMQGIFGWGRIGVWTVDPAVYSPNRRDAEG